MNDIINKKYKLTEDIKPLCRGNIIKKETIVTVINQLSKNRIIVSINEAGWSHRIKKSNLNRVGIEILEEGNKNENT